MTCEQLKQRENRAFEARVKKYFEIKYCGIHGGQAYQVERKGHKKHIVSIK